MSIRVNRRIPLLWMCLCWACGAVFSGGAESATFERIVSLETFRPRISEVSGEWFVNWDRAHVNVEAGAPEVPWLVLTAAVPADQEVVRVELVPLVEREIGPGARLHPTPRLGDDRRPIQVEPDPEAYAVSRWEPVERGRVVPSGYYEGHRVVGLHVAPVQYLPQEGRLKIADSFVIRIHTVPAVREPQVLRRLRQDPDRSAHALRRLQQRVDYVLETAFPRELPSPPTQPRELGFAPTPLPSLDGTGVDYVIVTAEAFADSFQILADWKTKLGIRTVVVSIESILDAYEAPDLAGRVRTFLQHAYAYWGTQYALLGGDSEYVPVRYIHTLFQSYPDGVDVATDLYYACLDGDWNADGDHFVGEVEDEVDLEPDIYVGRLPAATAAEAALMSRKSFWYSGGDPNRFNSTYQLDVSFWAEVLFWDGQDVDPSWPGDCDAIYLDGASIADSLYYRMSEVFRDGTTMYYEARNCWLEMEPPPPYLPESVSRSLVLNDFNTGRHIVTHVGHGFRNLMAVGGANDKIYNEDADNVTNGDKLSILYAINCTSGAVDYDCITEHFLRNHKVRGNGGAVSAIAATDLDYPSTSREITEEFFGLLFREAEPYTMLGETFHEANRLFAPRASEGDNGIRWSVYTLILLSDPTLDVWTAPPEGLRVELTSHPDMVYEMGSGPLTVTVFFEGSTVTVPDVRVTLYKEGELFVTALTDENGEVTFDDPHFASVGELTLGFAKHDHVPVIENLEVVAPTSAYLHLAGGTIDDAAGNANGAADRGESIGLVLGVGNAGGSTAIDVALEAATSSEYVTVTTPTAGVASIGAGGQEDVVGIQLDLSSELPVTRDYVEAAIDVAFTIGGSPAGGETYTLRILNPRLRHIGLRVFEDAGGTSDGDGVVEAGESAKLVATVLNVGQGALLDGKVQLAAVFPESVTVTSGEAPVDPQPGLPSDSGELGFDVVGVGGMVFDLFYVDGSDTLLTRRLDVVAPPPPSVVWTRSGEDYIQVSWEPVEEADVLGYNVYRASVAKQEFERANVSPVRGGFFASLNLPPLTIYQFTVTTVDSSGNESAPADTIQASTSPPSTAGWPVALKGSNNRGSITPANLNGDRVEELTFGSDYLYVIKGDGTDYYNGDGSEATTGVFSTIGNVPGVAGFWCKPAVADIDLDGILEIVAVHFTSGQVFVWDAQGGFEWGAEGYDVGEKIWSSPAVGNIDDDPEMEIVFWSGSSQFSTGDDLRYRGAIIAFNHDGTEVFNGDNNGLTTGVLWKTSIANSGYNYGSVALWDLDGDGRDEIVAGEKFGSDGVVHLIDYRPGVAAADLDDLTHDWPFDPAGAEHQFTSSPAIADVNGDGTVPEDYEIFIISKRALFGLTSEGDLLPGYPKIYESSTSTDFNDFLPSPGIGDINGDGLLDVVHGWKNATIYAYTAATGEPLAGWPVQLDISGQNFERAMLNCVVANLDADEEPEVLIGSGGGELYGLNGDGSPLAGFPYQFGGTIFGAPAVSDFDRNGSVDIAVIGQTTRAFSLEVTGIPFESGRCPWREFRHDARNSGVHGSFDPTPINLGSLVLRSSAPGRVEISWLASGEYLAFDIDRASPGRPRETIGEVAGRTGGRYAFVDEAAPAGELATYWIAGRTPSGMETAGPFNVMVMGRLVIARTVLFQNSPNPFNPRTEIGYEVAGEVGGEDRHHVRLQIFDVQGRLVSELVNERQQPGEYRLSWDGRDEGGLSVPSGIYLYRLQVGDETHTRKLVVAR